MTVLNDRFTLKTGRTIALTAACRHERPLLPAGIFPCRPVTDIHGADLVGSKLPAASAGG